MAFISAADADKNSYDVIVVGSGAAGGQTAYTLTMDGAKVLMLEAGRNYQPATETPMLQANGEAPLRGAGTPEKPFGFWDATVDGGWQVPGEPYSSASDDPARQFVWWRARMLGGRTNHWGRISLRNGQYDFKPHSRDGLGFDWPMDYADLAPYYDKVEMLIGVYGANDGLENTPNSSPGVLLPPPKPRVSDLLTRQRAAKLNIPVIPGHRAVLTQRLDHVRLPKLLHPGNAKAQKILAADMQKRAACFFATPCGRGCSIRANYQSTTVHLPPALDTGNLDIVTDAMVRAVTKRPDGRAEGVIFIDRKTGAEHRVKARVVVLAASALESVRIMLNSGVANSSGKVGKYIMDTVGAGIGGQIPLLEDMPLHNEDGVDGFHLYTPWWLYKEQLAGKLGFARGYHIEFGGGRSMPSMGTAAGMEWLNGGTYGRKFKEEARRYFGSFMYFSGRGEMIPNDDCYAELHPTQKDKFGIPTLNFHWKWSKHEIGQAAHMQTTFAEIIDAMGGRMPSPPQPGEKAIKQGGIIIHEVGGAMMGNDPAKSVTNSFGQSWDMKNLFITDGATLCSNADKNPTLTIMALAWRASEHMLGLMKKKEL
ncbi:MAG: GMC family oxidoreductase [Pseudomonadota bacterium]